MCGVLVRPRNWKSEHFSTLEGVFEVGKCVNLTFQLTAALRGLKIDSRWGFSSEFSSQTGRPRFTKSHELLNVTVSHSDVKRPHVTTKVSCEMLLLSATSLSRLTDTGLKCVQQWLSGELKYCDGDCKWVQESHGSEKAWRDEWSASWQGRSSQRTVARRCSVWNKKKKKRERGGLCKEWLQSLNLIVHPGAKLVLEGWLSWKPAWIFFFLGFHMMG